VMQFMIAQASTPAWCPRRVSASKTRGLERHAGGPAQNRRVELTLAGSSNRTRPPQPSWHQLPSSSVAVTGTVPNRVPNFIRL
jgi:hypothetical protein